MRDLTPDRFVGIRVDHLLTDRKLVRRVCEHFRLFLPATATGGDAHLRERA